DFLRLPRYRIWKPAFCTNFQAPRFNSQTKTNRRRSRTAFSWPFFALPLSLPKDFTRSSLSRSATRHRPNTGRRSRSPSFSISIFYVCRDTESGSRHSAPIFKHLVSILKQKQIGAAPERLFHGRFLLCRCHYRRTSPAARSVDPRHDTDQTLVGVRDPHRFRS